MQCCANEANELEQCTWASLRVLMEDGLYHLLRHAYDGFFTVQRLAVPKHICALQLSVFLPVLKISPAAAFPLHFKLLNTFLSPSHDFVLRPLINLHTLSFLSTNLLQFPSFHHHGPTTASCRRVTKNLL